jgi:hypothetical protein
MNEKLGLYDLSILHAIQVSHCTDHPPIITYFSNGGFALGIIVITFGKWGVETSKTIDLLQKVKKIWWCD